VQHLNYFTLKALARELEQELEGGRWQDAFTQEKDELVIVFRRADGRPLFLRVSCRTDMRYVLPQRMFRRARANSVDLFEELHDRPLQRIEMAPGDRMLRFHLTEEHTVVLKMHGHQANVIHQEAGVTRALFRTELTEDLGFEWPDEAPFWPNSVGSLQTALAAAPASDERAALKQIYPFFDRAFLEKIEELQAHGYHLYDAVQEVLRLAEDGHYYLAVEGVKPHFLLFPLPEYEDAEAYDSVEEALAAYVGKAFYQRKLETKRKELRKALDRALKQRRKQYESAQQGLARLQTARPDEELGHLLMANLHNIAPGQEEAEVEDLYQGGTVKIKLDPNRSPQENAEHFYEKHKDNKKKLARQEDRLLEAEEALEQLQQLEQDFEQLTTLKQLEQFEKRNRKLLGTSGKGSGPEAPTLPYREFAYRGWPILVGKDARKSDELTFGHAKKSDLWLHAKDGHGSHVIVPCGKNSTVPQDVLDYAAGLAAWFSKQRTNSVVPIQYTRRKYLRKAKRLPPGKVLVDREEVIMAEPVNPKAEAAG
jgi:predicted ribosome quality control (RQC) complex YloA/Tae2 family protein